MSSGAILWTSMSLNKYAQGVKKFIKAHENDIRVGLPMVLIVVFLVGLIMFATYRNMPHIVYQPAKACDLLTPEKAQDLLGEKVIGVERNKPVISGDTAISKCSYTDENPDENNMMVAAVAIRSGINDKGVKQNKTDFKLNKSADNVEEVKDLGNSAYFDSASGQLNILDGRRWIIVNYGVGSSPETNSVDKAVELAHLILK